MARQKTVYKTDEIAHLWAHRTQESARNAQGNFYFDGDTIYSYGSHFPIARHITAGKKVTGEVRRAVLMTTRGYSTTAGHIADVRRAIPGDVTVFHVPRVDMTPAELQKYYQDQVNRKSKELIEGSKKPLMHRNKRVELYREILADAKNGQQIIDFFGQRRTIKVPKLPEGLLELAAEVDEAKRVGQERRDAKRAIERRQYDLRREQERAERAAKIPEMIEAWQRGERIPWQFENDLPTMLRIEGAEVVTTRGARFPLEHAVKVLPVVKALIEGGRTYKRNGHTIHLGHYALDEIREDGTVIAGCHIVSKDEALRFVGVVEGMTADGSEGTDHV